MKIISSKQIYHEMIDIFPDGYKNYEYLNPVYGCYRFAIHAVYRVYHGWYNTRNPTDLFPEKESVVFNEFFKNDLLDARELLAHGMKLVNDGKFQLALHVIDLIIHAGGPRGGKGGGDGVKGGAGDKDAGGGGRIPPEILLGALKLKSKVLRRMARAETSLIASNILENGARLMKPCIIKLKKQIKAGTAVPR
ncbi:MAG: alkyl sulfatase dimerization domain-containing protein [Promethearchaeota archaeon]